MGENINEVAPTLGFNIKTLFHKGFSLHICTLTICRRHARPLIKHPGDIGGQKTLRPFWRNHFEETDAVIWVIDSTDVMRLDDCRLELFSLLQEEVCVLAQTEATLI